MLSSDLKNRIESSYNISSAEMHAEDESLHWARFHENQKEKFLNWYAVENFRARLSHGRDDSQFRKSYLNDQEVALWKREIGDAYFEQSLGKHNIGNSQDVVWDGEHFVDYNRFFQISYDYILDKHIGSSEQVYCEIGSGYGALAEIILARHMRRETPFKYFLIDLPEANILSTYYLSNVFPDLSICLRGDIDENGLTPELVANHDIFILGTDLKLLENLTFDTVINARSMMEMENKVIRRYFDFIQARLSQGGHFLNVNRYHKWTTGELVSLHKYPYDNNWDIVVSKAAFKQSHIHVLLAKRRQDAGDIRQELASIEILGRDFFSFRNRAEQFRYFLENVIRQCFGKSNWLKLRKIWVKPKL